MQTKVISQTEDFEVLAEDWLRLQEQDPDATIYSTYHFARSWWEAYRHSPDIRLFIVAVYHANRIVGIGPFILETSRRCGLAWRTLKFLGRGDFLGVLIEQNPEWINSIVRIITQTVLNAKNQWDRLLLTHLNASSSLVSYLLKNPSHSNPEYLSECPYINFAKYESFEQYKKRHVPSNTNQYKNKLQREIGYQFEIVGNHRGTDILNEIQDIHILEQNYLKKVKRRQDRSSLYQNPLLLLYLRAVYEQNDQVLTFVLRNQENRLIGYCTCFLYKGVLHTWNIGYDPDYGKYRIGSVLFLEILQYLFATRLVEKLDFGAGRYSWKFEWTDDFDLVYRYEVWNEDKPSTALLRRLSFWRRCLEQSRIQEFKKKSG